MEWTGEKQLGILDNFHETKTKTVLRNVFRPCSGINVTLLIECTKKRSLIAFTIPSRDMTLGEQRA